MEENASEKILPLPQGFSLYFLFFLSSAMIAAGIIILYFIFYSSGVVREIQISGISYLHESDVLRILAVKKDASLSQDEVEQAVLRLKAHPAVEDASISLLSGVLEVTVSEKSCMAVVRSGEILYDLFSDMHVIQASHPGCSGVPLLSGSFAVDDNAARDADLLSAASGIALMKKTRPDLVSRISEIQVNPKKNSQIFLIKPQLRIVYSGSLTSSLIERVYAAVSYYEKENQASAWIDLTGRDAILVPKK